MGDAKDFDPERERPYQAICSRVSSHAAPEISQAMQHSDQHNGGLPFRQALLPILLTTGVFFFNFLARTLLAPFLPGFELEFGLDHTQAGSLYFFTIIGLAITLALSGFVSKKLGHRRTIQLSSLGVGLALLCVAAAPSFSLLIAGLFFLGLSAGIYIPSGLATLTHVTRPKDWGKALSVHEIAPNICFIVSPALVSLTAGNWERSEVFFIIGCAALLMCLAFTIFGPRVDLPSESPRPEIILRMVRRRTFWMYALLFALGVGASMTPYAMLPLFLVDDHEMSVASAGWLLTASRFPGPFLALASGFIIDRLGARATMISALFVTGLSTAALGLSEGAPLVAAIIIQPMATVAFFPAAFTSMTADFEDDIRNVAVSLIIPIALAFSIGVLPILLGKLGDAGRFGLGFTLLGVIVVSGTIIPLMNGIRKKIQN